MFTPHPDLADQFRRLIAAVTGALRLDGRGGVLAGPLALLMWFRTRRLRKEAEEAEARHNREYVPMEIQHLLNDAGFRFKVFPPEIHMSEEGLSGNVETEAMVICIETPCGQVYLNIAMHYLHRRRRERDTVAALD